MSMEKDQDFERSKGNPRRRSTPREVLDSFRRIAREKNRPQYQDKLQLGMAKKRRAWKVHP